MEPQKQQSSVWRDLFEPGWREREAARVAKFMAAIPLRETLVKIGRRDVPCGECHINPGERCDVCGAQQPG